MPGSIENQPYNLGGPTAVSSPEATISWGGLIGTIVVFLIILIVALWMIRRVNRFSIRNIDSPWVRVLDRQMLNNQQTLYLVEIAGKIQVLAGTDHHITKVTEINDPEIVAEILEEIAREPQEKLDKVFGGIWRNIKKKKTNDSFSTELERWLEEAKE
ncbi:MAG: flagellar biosynthesis protein FliO [Peptococcaceae bacterium]|nr:flagellar biosynthesis protein FliO [Peptococcaceae bacterium]